MRILLTGGAGFIGSHLGDYLIKKGCMVISLDNLITGNISNIAHLIGNKKFLFVKHNVVEYIYFEGKFDYVLHFASPASPVDYLRHPIPTLKVCSLGTHKTLGFAKEKKAKYLLASTSEVYGDPLLSPQKETYWGNVNPVGVRSVYDEGKRFAEALTCSYHNFHHLDTKIVRIFNTYGERMRINDGRCIPNFIYQALKNIPLTIYGDGQQTRSFCYISDMIEGIYKLMLSAENLPVNLGNPQEITIREAAEKIIKLTKSKSKIVFKKIPEDDPRQRKPDIEKAKEILKWKPKIPLEEGLEMTIRWFRNKI